MQENKKEQPEILDKKSFTARLKGITGRSLTPEGIDEYASMALNDLVGLIDDCIDSSSLNMTDYKTGKEYEETALERAGLDPGVIEQTLDHIASVDEGIKRLNKVIAKNTVATNKVIVPPDSISLNIVVGSGDFKPKEIIPRTKTIVFLASQLTETDIDNPDDLKITTGVLGDNMMREESYSLLELPKAGVSFLVCDEEGNATFVFDNEKLEELEITPTDLMDLTKSDIREFLEEEIDLGQAIKYSTRFTDRIINILTNGIEASVETLDNELLNVSNLLEVIPEAPEGTLSANGIAGALGISYSLASATIKALTLDGRLGGELVGMYRFGKNKGVKGYSPNQQGVIREELERRGIFAEEAPEGTLSAGGIAGALGISYSLASATIKALTLDGRLGGELVGMYRFGSKRVKGYSLNQQRIIEDWIRANTKSKIRIGAGGAALREAVNQP